MVKIKEIKTQNTKTKKNRRARRNKANPNRKQIDTLVNLTKAIDFSYNDRSKSMSKRRANVPRPILKPSDLTFLKAAFAPVDFGQLDLNGVPDSYTGPSIVKHHTLWSTVPVPAGKTKVLLFAPTPGIAYFEADNEYATDYMMLAKEYPDFGMMFGLNIESADTTWNCFSARYIGLSAEIRPMSSIVSNAGTIICAKIPLVINDNNDVTTGTAPLAGERWVPMAGQSVTKTIDLLCMNTTSLTKGPFYMGHVNDGMYSVASNTGDWSFCPLWNDVDMVPPFQMPFGSLKSDNTFSTFKYLPVKAKNGQIEGYSAHSIPGWCNHESIAVIIRNSGESTLELNIETHGIVEYQLNPNSVLYPFASASASPSPELLQMYAQLSERIPVAVGYLQNAEFWDRIRSILRSLFNAGSKYGSVANAVLPGLGSAISAGSSAANMFLDLVP